ncbi:MAG TPA: site-specific integrase [Woeseiaceae bacterium]|nr:site-specific integrase [Woeseiaceae bacterium]
MHSMTDGAAATVGAVPKEHGARFTSIAGYEVEFSSDSWRLDKTISLNIDSVASLLVQDSAAGFKCVLKFYAENFSAAHTSNCHQRLLSMLRTLDCGTITTAGLINYRSRLPKKRLWYLSVLKGFLKRWHELGYPGVSDDVVCLLNSWSLKGNKKGEEVKKLDPRNGPLSDIELQGLNDTAIRAFEKDQISITELAACLIISFTGRRPKQISHMKLCDLPDFGECRSVLKISVPRAKQSGAGFREETKEFAISSELAAILAMQGSVAERQMQGLLGRAVRVDERGSIPLFPGNLTGFKSVQDGDIEMRLGTDRFHCHPQFFTATLKRLVQIGRLNSERTGQRLQISSRRLRYTMGTRAAREGFGELLIAELLDHSDTQNAGVYIDNIPEHVEAINKAVGQQMAVHAQAFAGVLVDREEDATRGSDLSSRVRIDQEGVGTCGSYGFCGAKVPVPCYTCMHFQPWVDGPHERVLQAMLEERESVREVTGDLQIAAVNDRSIIAVMEVVRNCEIRKAELDNG